MRVAILASCVALLIVIVSVTVVARIPAATPPKCSASDTQHHRTLHGTATRFCGPARAVMRIEGKSFTITGGSCSGNRGSVRMGVLPGKGFRVYLWFKGFEHRRPGRNPIIDGTVELPGFSSLPHQGMSIFSTDLESATFSLGSPPRITGSWRCR